MNRARSGDLLPPAIIACVMLLVAIPSGLPYGYYRLLRWVICGFAIWFAFQASERHQQHWMWGFGVVAVIFNPLVPFYLGKELWSLVDLICAVLFPIGAVWMKRVK